jgi:ribosomal protein S18 acetylase RimI-like enzyme
VLVRPANAMDAERCVDVLRQLPTHFTPDTHGEALHAVRRDRSWVAVVDDRIQGFLVLRQRYALSAEITFAAVVPTAQRRGFGRAMVAEAVGRARSAGLRAIEVKTLDQSSGYQPYVATRAFWEGLGFVQIDCIDPLPGWQPGNPSAIYVLALAGPVVLTRPHRGA